LPFLMNEARDFLAAFFLKRYRSLFLRKEIRPPLLLRTSDDLNRPPPPPILLEWIAFFPLHSLRRRDASREGFLSFMPPPAACGFIPNIPLLLRFSKSFPFFLSRQENVRRLGTPRAGTPGMRNFLIHFLRSFRDCLFLFSGQAEDFPLRSAGIECRWLSPDSKSPYSPPPFWMNSAVFLVSRVARAHFQVV